MLSISSIRKSLFGVLLGIAVFFSMIPISFADSFSTDKMNVQIGQAVSNDQSQDKLGVFYQNTSNFNYQGGKIILSSTPDGTGELSTDDEVTIKVTHPNGSVLTYDYVYGYPANVGYVLVTTPIDVTYLFDFGTNKVEITYTNTMQGGAGSTPYYLTQLDTTAPITKYHLDAIYAQTRTGSQFIKGFTVSLQATDDQSGSGVKITQYRINGGAWNSYTTPFSVYAGTTHTVEYNSTDNAGNVETINKMDFDKGTFTGAGKY